MYILDHFAIIMQITQQVFVAEEWVKNARDEVNAMAHFRANAKKALRALKQENAELSEKLKEAKQAHLSAEACLKTTEKQAKVQCQKLYITEINLGTEKQIVLDLKAELQKAKDATRVAKEAAEATVKASYQCGVLDTETRLAKEVVVVCRDYCTEAWGVAMDRVGVPADSELRKAKNIFFLKDIREISNTVPPPKQLPTTQAPLPDAKVLKGAGVGEKTQPLMKATPSEDALTIKDVVSQAKDAELSLRPKIPNPRRLILRMTLHK